MTDPCTTPILGIDAHAHVFSKDLSLTSGRRYSPDYDATVQAYLAHLHEHGLSHGVLVQPSFLGTDNRFLFDALAQALIGCAVWRWLIPISAVVPCSVWPGWALSVFA